MMLIRYEQPVFEDILRQVAGDDVELQLKRPAEYQLSVYHDVIHWVVDNNEWIATTIGGGVLTGIGKRAGEALWDRFKQLTRAMLTSRRTSNDSIYVTLRSDSNENTIIVNTNRQRLSEAQLQDMFHILERIVWPHVLLRLSELGVRVEDAQIRATLEASPKHGTY